MKTYTETSNEHSGRGTTLHPAHLFQADPVQRCRAIDAFLKALGVGA